MNISSTSRSVTGHSGLEHVITIDREQVSLIDKLCNWALTNSRILVVQKMFSFLDVLTLTALESTCKKRFESFSDINWKYLRVRDDFEFTWADVEKGQDINKDKWNYALSKVFVTHLNLIRYMDSSSHDDLYKARLAGLMKRFPQFGYVFRQEFSRSIFGSRIFCCCRRQDEKIRREILDKPRNATYGGTALLRLFMMRHDKHLSISMKELRELIIENRVTCIGLIAKQLLSNLSEEHIEDLAILSARYKDFRLLQMKLNESEHRRRMLLSRYEYDREGLAPIIYCSAQALRNRSPQVEEDLLSRALKDYTKTLGGDIAKLYEKCLIRAPHELLIRLAEMRFQLGKYREAEPLYDRLIKLYGREVSWQILLNAIRIKENLGKYEEANVLSHEAMSIYKNNAAVLMEVTLVKSHLADQKMLAKEYVVADYFYRQIRKIYASSGSIGPDPRILAQAGYVKFYLDDFRSANQLFDQVITLYDSRAPMQVLWDAASLKSLLKDYKGADPLLDRAIKACVEDVPINLLVDSFNVKYHLKDSLPSDSHMDASLENQRHLYGENVAVVILRKSIEMSFYLENYQRLNLLLHQLIMAYRGSVPTEVLSRRDEVISCLKDYERMHQLLNQLIMTYQYARPVDSSQFTDLYRFDELRPYLGISENRVLASSKELANVADLSNQGE